MLAQPGGKCWMNSATVGASRRWTGGRRPV